MPAQTLVKRVEKLEREMTALQGLPAQVTELGVQILQLWTGTRAEFSAVREEMRGEFGAVREEMRGEFGAVREEMRVEFGAVREEIRKGDEETRRVLHDDFERRLEAVGAALRGEIRDGDEETRRQMRILHEDLVGRLALIQEGLSARRTRRKPQR